MRVYIAGAYSKGDVAMNVREAMLVADTLVTLGHIPHIPHLTHFWHMVSPKPYEFWLDYDMNFIDSWADCILRIDGLSRGADKEVKRAKEIGMPVYYKISDIPT